MQFDPKKHHRRSIRLPGYDYTTPGAYFVTICTRGRKYLFDNAVYRRVVEDAWHSIPKHFPHVRLDEFVVMPNHIHGIIFIVGARHSTNDTTGETPRSARKHDANISPQTNASPLPKLTPGSLGAIVGNFKSVSARRINRIRKKTGEPVWQRNYYEHTIRNENELNRIRQYIQINPSKWEYDRENPSRRMDARYEKQWGWVEKPQ